MSHTSAAPRRAGLTDVMVLLTVLLVLALSAGLMSAKRQKAAMQADLEASTRAFVRGIELPPVPLVQGSGPASDLRELCRKRSPVVAVFTSATCEACNELNGVLARLAAERPDLNVVMMYPEPPPTPTAVPKASFVRSTILAFVNVAGVSTAPSVIVTGPDCRIVTAGTGPAGTHAALRHLVPTSQ